MIALSTGAGAHETDGFALLSTDRDDPFGLRALEPVRWGRLAGTDSLRAEAFGFPELADEQRGNLEHAVGKVIPCSGAVAGPEQPGWRLAFQVESGTPAVGVEAGALWRGASGAALLGEGHLLGVLTEWHPIVSGRLRALPVELLRDQKTFLQRMAEYGVAPVVFEPMWAGWQVLEPAYTPLPESWSAADLLLARHQVVEFAGREAELHRLMEWCLAPGRSKVSVMLMTGDGAVGKTRLARELCKRVAARGWLCGMLCPLAEDLSSLIEVDEDRLIVVDDADVQVGQLDVLLRRRSGHGRLRLLAIARHADQWWTTFHRRYDELIEERPLDVAPMDTATREAVYAHAHAAFLHKQREAGAAPEAADFGRVTSPEAPADLADPDFSSCLFILILALIDIRQTLEPAWSGASGPGGAGTRRQALYEQALDLEREDWIKHAELAGLTADPVLLDRVVAVASLAFAGGDTDGHMESEAARCLRMVPDLADATELTRRRYVRLFQERIHGQGALRPLRPIRLAEHLAEQVIRDFPETVAELLDLPRDAHGSPEDAARQALSTLQLLNAVVFGNGVARSCDEVLHDALHEALRLHAPKLVALVGKVLEDRDNSTGRSLATALEGAFAWLPDGRIAAQAADELEEACPDALLSMARVLHTRAVDYYSQEPHTAQARSKLGTAHRRLARVLADAGFRRSAHHHAWQAVKHHSALVRTDGSYEHLLDKAHALSSLSVRAYDIGHFSESLDAAREAVQIYEELLRSHPDRRHHVHLSFALCNLSQSLAHLGRWREALQNATDALDLVTADLPTESTGPPVPAAEIAEAEAFARRSLARRQPQGGQIAEAIASAAHACRLYGQLRETQNGRTWDGDFAQALVVLGRRYTDNREWDKSIETLSQALSIYRELEHEYQEAERTRHADALRDLAEAHLGKAREHGPDESSSLDAALHRAQEALAQHDLMAQEDKYARRESRARTMRVLAEAELCRGRAEQARDHARDALAILQYVPDRAWRGRVNEARLRCVYGDALAELGDAVTAAGEYQLARDLYQVLDAEEPDRVDLELRRVGLRSRSTAERDSGRF
ncbi:Tetratricopeptide repeat family [[Actinomadura] parvosata subsp. kistnae]|nr:Tetratricopeptide repeat family [Actinomadura parvosata subsp. kistnae]